jgi:hypothetical protein
MGVEAVEHDAHLSEDYAQEGARPTVQIVARIEFEKAEPCVGCLPLCP